MLVAAIERNQASAGDKFIARVMPLQSSIPVAKREDRSSFHRQFPKDRRHSDRRVQPTSSVQMEGPDYIISLSLQAKEYVESYRKNGLLDYH